MSARSAKIIEVIEVRTFNGKGVDGDVYREVVEYWSIKGELLAAYDPCPTTARPRPPWEKAAL